MIKSISILVLSVICLSLYSKNNYNQAYQKTYLPDAVKNVYIGMPFSAFSKLNDIGSMEVDSAYGNMYIQYTATKLPAGVVSLYYKFDMNDVQEKLQPLPSSPLYEIGIEFTENTDMAVLTTKLFGKVKDVYKMGDQYHFYDKQWFIKTKDNLTLMVRQTGYYIMIAGVIKGTEWSVD